jgi:hypothetical protein
LWQASYSLLEVTKSDEYKWIAGEAEEYKEVTVSAQDPADIILG